MRRRVPSFSSKQLTDWFCVTNSRHKTVYHFHILTQLNLLLIDKLDLVRRTAASAKLYGIDFFSALTRGSQFRVEAVLLRKAHADPRNYVALSPSPMKVHKQAAMSCTPLVMEPVSIFYEDPVVILDFQSLYPSIIMAYNMCFSTIIAQIKKHDGMGMPGADTTERLGTEKYPETYSAAAVGLHPEGEQPHIAPNGSVFCSKNVRHGILPQMLSDVVNARLFVKRSIKEYNGPGDSVLRQVLDALQLALKLLANVTCK